MSSNDQSQQQPVPDLASVLKILASVANKNREQAEQSAAASQLHTQNIQPPAVPMDSHSYQQHPTQQAIQHQPQPQSYPAPAQQTATPPSKPVKVIDPATITDWPAAVKCVMRTIAQREDILKDIQRMVTVQHEHEEQWWASRKDLVKKQEARVEGQKKLDDVMKAIGGAVSEGKLNSSPEDMARELKTFDMKVHRAQVQMVREMTTRLRNHGVPFFGTKSDLVLIEGKKTVENPGNTQDQKRVISEAELVKLQKRMLDLLEDMSRQ